MPSGRVQVKPDCEGCTKRQISETQHSENREDTAEVLSFPLILIEIRVNISKRKKAILLGLGLGLGLGWLEVRG